MTTRDERRGPAWSDPLSRPERWVAEARIETLERIDSERTIESVVASCSECGYKAYTAGHPGRDWTHLIDDHLAQHGPGRALDIDVDWVPSAWCSVCGDGGDVIQEDDGLTCRCCGTEWSIDGRWGSRQAPEDTPEVDQ